MRREGYSVAEVAEVLNYSRLTIYRWYEKGWLDWAVIPAGKSLRFSKEKIEGLAQVYKDYPFLRKVKI